MSKVIYPPVIGWFSGANQAKPVFDGGLVPCPYCGVTIKKDDCRTESIMAEDREPMLSVFYRSHKKCNELDTEDELGHLVMDMLDKMRQPNPLEREE